MKCIHTKFANLFIGNMQEEKSNKIVANWVFVGVAMLIIQVLIGGITRLSGSGLSITEWKPIMGALPPTTEAAWQQAFLQYQKIAQFKYINSHFILNDFKFIFFWEWFHRLWARFIAIAFIIPFIYFIVKKHIKQWMINPLIILFILGGLQGLIGWIMVKSGLNDDNVYVSHIKLAVHFVSAMVLISYALIFALSLKFKPQDFVINPTLKKTTIGLIGLLTLQLFYGAFMAGLKAASTAPTWPTINGKILPENMLNNGWIAGLFFNPITIHFIHRTMAYVLFAFVIFWWIKAKQITNSVTFTKAKNYPLYLVIFQIALGILTVLTSTQIVLGSFGVFEWMALLHQLVGMLLLLSIVANVYLIKQKA